MRRLVPLIAVLAALSLPACGDDPDSSGSNGDMAEAEAPTGDAAVTAKKFNKLPIPDEFKLIERLAADNSGACSGVNARSEPYRQAVFINAAQAKPETLIADLVAEACEAG
jgi:hypothetical protein